MGRLLPIRKPTPLAADNVHERVSHGTKPAAQIARELLNAERGDRLQNSVVRPPVVFVEQLNVIFSHGDGRPLSFGQSCLATGVRQGPTCGRF
jgi:hypothetical protein